MLAHHALRYQGCVVMRYNYPVCARDLTVEEESGMDGNPPVCNQTVLINEVHPFSKKNQCLTFIFILFDQGKF
jgi:hypothetical protein